MSYEIYGETDADFEGYTPDQVDLELIIGGEEPEERSEITLFKDNYLEVRGEVFLIDDPTVRILKAIGRAEDAVSRAELVEVCFGGEASPAQERRFDECIAILAGIEETTSCTIFEIYTREGSSSLQFEPTCDVTVLRKPYITEKETEEADEEVEEKADVLTEIQKKIVTEIADMTNYTKSKENVMQRRTLAKAVYGKEKLSFDQEVEFNQQLAVLNEWFERHGIDFSIKPFVSLHGPAFEVSSIFRAEDLAEEVSQTEALILQQFEVEAEIRQEQARLVAEQKATKEARRKPKSVIAGIKEIKVRRVHPLAEGINIPEIVNDVDRDLIDEISDTTEIDRDLVAFVRDCIGRVVNGGKELSPDEQRKTIAFLQQGRDFQNRFEGTQIDANLKLWLDGAFSAMAISYSRNIQVWAWKLSGNLPVFVPVLEAAGLKGVEDAIIKYDSEDENRNPQSYFNLRIHGEMTDAIRDESLLGEHGRRGQYDVASLEYPYSPRAGTTKSGGDEDDLTLKDWLEDQTKEVGHGEVYEARVRDIIIEAVNSLREEKVRSDRNLDRDIRISLFYFGLTFCMEPQDRVIFEQLVKPGKTGLVQEQIAGIEGLDVTASRVSQITTRFTNELGKYIRRYRDILND